MQLISKNEFIDCQYGQKYNQILAEDSYKNWPRINNNVFDEERNWRNWSTFHNSRMIAS